MTSSAPATDGDHRELARGALHDVGEVDLALRVVAADRAQRVEEEARGAAVDAGVDLVDALFVDRGVLVLDDAHEPATAVAHDAAVAARIGQARRHHRHGRAARRPAPAAPAPPATTAVCRRRGSAPGRRAPASSDSVCSSAWPVPRCSACRATSMAPAPKRALDGGTHRVGLVAEDAHDPLRAERARHGDGVLDHRPAGDGVQHLGFVRLHARAEAGGEDDGGERHVAEVSVRCRGGSSADGI